MLISLFSFTDSPMDKVLLIGDFLFIFFSIMRIIMMILVLFLLFHLLTKTLFLSYICAEVILGFLHFTMGISIIFIFYRSNKLKRSIK